MTIQPARHECHACCPQQAEKPGIQSVVGNTHGTPVEQVGFFSENPQGLATHMVRVGGVAIPDSDVAIDEYVADAEMNIDRPCTTVPNSYLSYTFH